MKKHKIITVCGNTKFKEKFQEIQKMLTLGGYIVISIYGFEHNDDTNLLNGSTKEMLASIHAQKIEMADEIFVIDVGGYIGPNTKREIQHAENFRKKIRYYSKM